MIGSDQTCSGAGYSWTTWFDRDDPSGNEDNETKDVYVQAGYDICNSPTALEVSVKNIKINIKKYIINTILLTHRRPKVSPIMGH